MTRPYIPQPVLDAAHARAAARAARDWATADRLRGEIEAAGWKIVDRGTDFALEPASPPEVVDDAGTRYGRSDAVPSRLAEPPLGAATVVVVATDWADDVSRAVRAVAATSPGTGIVVVADGPPAQTTSTLAALAGVGIEVVGTSARLGTGAAWNIGIRRAGGEVVIVLDASVEPAGDIVMPLVEALRDPGVAVAGPFGLVSTDLRRFEEVEAGEAAAIEGYVLAFRRSDAARLGPIDEGFRFYRNLDIWWSLSLRDGGEDDPPRRALVVADLPLVRHEHRAWEATDEAERDRLSRRNFYRVLDRFRGRLDLVVPPSGS